MDHQIALSEWILGLGKKEFEHLIAHQIFELYEPDAYQYTWTEYDRSGPEAWSKDGSTIVEVTTTDSTTSNIEQKIRSDLDKTVWNYIRNREGRNISKVINECELGEVNEYSKLSELRSNIDNSDTVILNKLDEMLSEYSIIYFTRASKSEASYKQQTIFDADSIYEEFPMQIKIYGHSDIVDTLAEWYQMLNSQGGISSIEQYIEVLDREQYNPPRFKRNISRDNSDIRIRADFSTIQEVRDHLNERFEDDVDNEKRLDSFVDRIEEGPDTDHQEIDTSIGDSATLYVMDFNTFNAFVAYHYGQNEEINRAEIIDIYSRM